MSNPQVPYVDSVFHPTDFSDASELAFAHALAIAVSRRTDFTMLHAGGKHDVDGEWKTFPPVRRTLERWGYLEPESTRSAVFRALTIKVRKIEARSGNPVAASLRYLDEHPTDLIVLATEGKEGIPRWLKRSVAEELATRSKVKTLFVPDGSRGFVHPDNGSIVLRNIVVPVVREPDPAAALEYARRAAAASVKSPVKISVVHVGDASTMPDLDLPEDPACTWETRYRAGDPVEEIEKAARIHKADVVVMPTTGRHGILDALRGSVTERVLRRLSCPLLAVPE